MESKLYKKLLKYEDKVGWFLLRVGVFIGIPIMAFDFKYIVPEGGSE